MSIERITRHDVPQVYAFLETIPELQVMPGEPFMDRDEFESAALNDASIALVYWSASMSFGPTGFIYARIGDGDARSEKSACIVYIAVRSDCRGFGIGRELMDACRRELATRGVTNLYLWADEKSGVIDAMHRLGFRRGKSCVWMQGKIDGQLPATTATSAGE